MRVWTLINPVTQVERLQPGNKQAPAAIVFRTKEDAEAFIESAGWRSRQPAELELDGTYEESTTRDGRAAQTSYHVWHLAHGSRRSKKCGFCMSWKPTKVLAADATIVETRIIDPATGEPV